MLLLSTTSEIPGRNIREYRGIVFGETIFGANVFKDFLAGIRDIVGGRSNTYEKVVVDARNSAIAEMESRAAEIGANAIVGIKVDYETLGANNGMMMVTVSGTAVVV